VSPVYGDFPFLHDPAFHDEDGCGEVRFAAEAMEEGIGEVRDKVERQVGDEVDYLRPVFDC
jgi:hypothetical protein